MNKVMTVKLQATELELIERIRQHFNERSNEIGQGELYGENEIELLLGHIIRDYASSRGLYKWE
ncbi:MAG: hypothetical protein BAA01_09550 [Bacillus thermozeamaize]|uniref:Uncharacterized protein n=1 Tax=Bacillus thermozeamaize TaxID=230954 RepID=A0A1Y3PEG8_9BACI|nr:MAG: hypothetical protein BAA01_09550 [Bacillus thermozeamaize]